MTPPSHRSLPPGHAGAPGVAPAPHVQLTYAEFETQVRTRLARDGWNAQRIANIASALHGWQRALKLDAQDIIGDEFRAGFATAFRRYEDMIANSLSVRTQRDRQEQIHVLKRLFDTLAIDDLLPASFGDALTYAFNRSGETLAQIGRLSGLPTKTLSYWLSGSGTPQRATNLASLATLEIALGLPAMTLAKRLPQRRLLRYERQRNEPSSGSVTPRTRQNSPPTLCPALRPTVRLEQQWLDLIRFKTDVTREGATARNSWRLKPLERVGLRVNWAMLCDGLVCVTGGAHWAFFGQYLGFLTSPHFGRSAIDRSHADTLAWLAVPAYIKSYVQFLRRRAGNITHHGVVTFLNNVRSHLRATTGYVWLHSELADDLAAAGERQAAAIAQSHSRDADWQAYCERAHRELLTLERSLAAHSPARFSRDPTRPIEQLLADDFPLKRLVRFVRDLEADEPPQLHRRDYAAWIRDVLLCKMLISNPLRASQFSTMRFRGQRPNLYQSAEGHWRLRFDPSDFKNEKGAASEPYDTAVEPSVSPWIRRYFVEARPLLVGADTDYVFLPAVTGPNRGAGYSALGLESAGNWNADNISKRVKTVTARYIEDTDGFGPHAFRHIVATDHLKRHPQDYMTVAQLLHDKLETVIKAYAHLRVDDGLRTLHAGVAQAMQELEDIRADRKS
ncbi:hypothetical protein PQR64_28960 [Paraburkholderia phytofirmans]|uniref:hypothetical protein n=1 Tax=Paraburkholderia phytofirmans TaxID=261302 RepID=UPI0038B6CF56